LDVWTFYIPYDYAIGRGWSEVHIEALLAEYGIKTWGGLIHFGEYFFKVKLNQAAWAEYILTNHGIPLQKKSQGAPHPQAKARLTPARARQVERKDALSFLDDLDKFLSPLLR
jgi:hypothetical protein